MKLCSHTLSPSVARGIAFLCAAVFVIGAPSTAPAAGVVGTGTAASCTDAALNTALAGGGLVTFNCGGPATIDISTGTSTKTIAADTIVDGGGLITINGGNSDWVFSVDSGVNSTLENLTIANGVGGVTNSGSLTITNSTLSGNGALGLGGGIYNDGTLKVTNSTFTGNSVIGIYSCVGCGERHVVRSGGSASNSGSVTVSNSTFAGNSDAAIYSTGGSLSVTNSSFIGNNSNGSDGAAINNYSAPMIVTNTTFAGNRNPGIYNSGGPLTVTNSTFTGNGSGITNSGSLTVTNSTFTGNHGSAIAIAGGPALLRNTIVAHTSSRTNCFGEPDAITDGGHNLDDSTSCGFSAANGSLANTDPQLDPAGLHHNGGPTQTVALCTAVGAPAGCIAASPAIGAGDQAVCAAAPVNDLDQRGLVRPGTGHTQCSIGAYEADGTPPVCGGDCDGLGSVTVDEVLTLVHIALGTAQPSACLHGVPNGAAVNVALIIQAVNNALSDCGSGQ